MSFSVGIVGLPNVGKSTLFSALTRKKVDISAYPFCTIHPNVGIVQVSDKRLDKIAELIKSEKKIPTVVEFIDIAGLISGAHKGEGLGNQFLAHIREVDAILHLVRVFEDPNVAHPGTISPIHDIQIINLELILADLATLDKYLEKIRAKAKADKKLAKTKEVLEKIKKVLEEGKPAKDTQISKEEKELISELSLLTFKPVLYMVNVNDAQLDNPPTLPVKPAIYMSAKLEFELQDLSLEEKKEYLEETGIQESRLDVLTGACYQLLDLIIFYTCVGQKETRAWTLKRGSDVIEAAGLVHTDFAKNFKKAEIIPCADFVKAGSETKARELGLIKTEGKDYLVCDGDIIHFKI
jgi:hypothetical protein